MAVEPYAEHTLGHVDPHPFTHGFGSLYHHAAARGVLVVGDIGKAVDHQGREGNRLDGTAREAGGVDGLFGQRLHHLPHIGPRAGTEREEQEDKEE